MEDTFKKCKGCNKIKKLDEFPKKQKGGHYTVCKRCSKYGIHKGRCKCGKEFIWEGVKAGVPIRCEEHRNMSLKYLITYEHKVCTKCHKVRHVNEFYHRSNGKVESMCRTCCVDRSRVYRKNNPERARATDKKSQYRARLWLMEQKKKPCIDCGKIYHPYLMDFDHVRGEKKKSVSQMTNSRFDKDLILDEIAKCDLVCCMCHRVRTWNRMHPEDKISLIKKDNK